MPTTVKVKLREKDREIEVEGSPAHVDRLLAKWWLAGRLTTGSSPLDIKKAVNGQKSDVPPSEATEELPEDPVEATALRIQRDDRFRYFARHVLHAPNNINKIRLVCLFAVRPLTTGEIRKVLVKLGVRIGTTRVSHTVKKYALDFILDQQRRSGVWCKYQLTGKASGEFQHWLNSDG